MRLAALALLLTACGGGLEPYCPHDPTPAACPGAACVGAVDCSGIEWWCQSQHIALDGGTRCWCGINKHFMLELSSSGPVVVLDNVYYLQRPDTDAAALWSANCR